VPRRYRRSIDAAWRLVAVAAILCVAACDPEFAERQAPFGRVSRMGREELNVVLSSENKLESVLNMGLFARTVPNMTYDAAVQAFGPPVGQRTDNYQVVWHKFIVPSGSAEVGLAKAGSAGDRPADIIGWWLDLHPDDVHGALTEVFKSVLMDDLGKLDAKRGAEVRILSHTEQQQVNFRLSNGRVEQAAWVHMRPLPTEH